MKQTPRRNIDVPRHAFVSPCVAKHTDIGTPVQTWRDLYMVIHRYVPGCVSPYTQREGETETERESPGEAEGKDS